MKKIAYFETPAAPATLPGAVILIERDDPQTPYITWWEVQGGGGRMTGHYFSDRKTAEADFIARCQRGY